MCFGILVLMSIQMIFYVISHVTMKRTSVTVPKECL